MNLRIFCLGIIVFLVGCDPAPIREAQREISDAMRDPGSANFRNSKIIEADGVTFVCGEVNGKNAFGAMAGYRHYLYMDPLMRVGTTNQSSLAIYQCCSSLEKTNTFGGANSTSEIEQCKGVEPPLPLVSRN
jgi:hypothetical protein